MLNTFDAPDGTVLAYHGDDGPVVVPGGPMRESAYLADLPLPGPWIRLDLRGTGASGVPGSADGYRCDRQAGDLEALRAHLGRERLDLVAHSAGAAVAVHYAARHPSRVARLILINPSPRVVELPITDEERLAAAEGRRGEPWFPAAFAALQRLETDEDFKAITPFTYGREHTDTTAQNVDAARAYYGPPVDRAALAAVTAPVLIVSGECDLQLPPAAAAAYAGLFPSGRLDTIPKGSHFAWYDDRSRTATILAEFLR